MSILTTHGLAQSFGDYDVFSGVTVSIPRDGKVGLVGPNGVGKTTLLLILAGLAAPARGRVTLARGTRLGYLPQESAQAFTGLTHSVYQEMLAVFSGLRAEEKALREMEARLAEGELDDELFAAYGRAQAAFELAGGYEYELRVRQVLTGLGFPPDKWELSLAHLSGGQKTRALLARLLLEQPDLLILDEPTNHLDVAALEWLEGTMRLWEGALLVVSHDRYFLDRVVNHVWELSTTGLESYRGNYSAYVAQREARWALREQEYEDVRARLEKELDYIRRHIAGQRTRQAQGKLSRAGREVQALHLLGLDGVRGKSWLQIAEAAGTHFRSLGVAELAEQIKSLPRPDYRPVTLDLRLNAGHRSGNIVLRAADLVVGYPGAALFTVEALELHRGARAALIGPNGTGKSTFLKVVTGQLTPLTGDLQPGASLKLGYFAQAHDNLNPDSTVLDELLRHRRLPLSQARNFLARYLFRGDEVFQPVSTLSGGERGRLALAILALQDANFLLLDEPTNHLDLPAQEVLQSALEQFDGTIILVSHDRYLVDRLATEIWLLEEGRLRVFAGSYQAYLEAREAEQAAGEPEAKLTTRAGVSPGTNTPPGAGLSAATIEPMDGSENGRGLSKNEARRRARDVARLEAAIAGGEARLAALAAALQEASAAGQFDTIQSLSLEYEATRAELDGLMAQWELIASE